MSFIKDENGQGMVEYALIIGLIALALVILLVAFGGRIKNTFSKAENDENLKLEP